MTLSRMLLLLLLFLPALRFCACRDPPGAASGSEAGAARWEAAEFRVKWRRSSYTHCTWEPLAVLRSLPGFKRVTNYCK